MSAGHGEIRVRREQCCGVDGCLRPAWKDGVCFTCWRAYRWLRSPADPAQSTLLWLEAVWSLPPSEDGQAI